MGYPTQQQKVDYLFKKIGFTKTKTGVAEDQTSGFSGDTKKAPPNEAIASPLIVPGSSVWSDSSFITATPPTSSTAYVGVYSTATAYRMTVDTTVANERTFIARQTWGNPSSAIEGDWIDTQFGADYLVKVYKNDPSVGIAGIDYFDLSAAGTSGKDDVWFFDYSSGVLNFNGEDLDGQLSGITTSNIYIVGYRYTGRKGIQPPAGIGTFHDLVVSNNLSVGGISTFNGDVNVATNAKVKVGTGLTFHFNGTNTLYSNTSNVLHTIENSGQREAWNSRVSGVYVPSFKINHNSAVEAYYANGDIKFSTSGIGITVYGQLDTTTLNVAGVSTFAGTIDANGLIEGIAGENKIPSLYANYSNLPNAGTYHGMFAHVHATQKGYFAHAGGWYELVNKETTGVVGTGTETYHIGNLNVTGITTLGSIGISTGLITGPAVTYIDPATVGDNTGTLVVKGNLQVEGTQTTVNSSTMTVTDKNIELAKGAANDAAADGGGITVDSGDGDKTWQWVDATDSWTSSEHIRIPDDKVIGFATDTNTHIGRPAADTIAFTNGGDETFRITSAGRVGINTTNPTSKLQVDGTFAVVTQSYLTNQNHPSKGGNALFVSNNSSTETARFYCTAAGNTKIHIESSANNGYSELHFCDQEDRTGGGALHHESSSGEIVYDHSNDAFRFNTNKTEKLRIMSSGDVGIGTDNPTGSNSLTDNTATLAVGIVTTNSSFTRDLRVSGISTFIGNANFNDDITIQSANGNNIVFDKSDNALKFGNDVELRFGLFQQFRIRQNGTTGSSEIIHNRPQSLVLHSDKLDLRPYTNTAAVYLRANYNSSINLYYANSVKFATSGIGVTVTGETKTTTLNVTGVSTFTGISTFSSTVVSQKSVQIEENLNVTGITTFNGAITLPPGTGGNFGNIQVGVTGANEIDTSTGNLTLDSAGGRIIIDDNLSVSGITTLTGDVTLNAGASSLMQLKFKNNITGFGVNDGAAVAYSTNSHGLFFSAFETAGNMVFQTGANNINNYTLLISNTGVVSLRRNQKNMLVATPNSHVKLYYNDTECLSTSGIGITVTGEADVNGDLNVSGITTTVSLNTGNTTFTGTITAGGSTGTNGQYLKSTGSGVAWASFPSSRTGLTTTATAGQTSFNFSYNIGFVDVFLNGVKLPSSEFTANNGSTIVLDDAAFANDTLEFISLNTIPVTSGGGGASNLDGLSDVTVTSPVYGQTLRYNGVKFVNDFHPHATTTSTSQVSITNLPIASYRSAEYLIQVTEGTKYHVTKIIAIHDGTNVTFNEYGTITTSTPLATFTLDINSGNMRLLATPASTNSTTFKVKFDAIAV